MFFYEGQACPVCGRAFTETDDIVACPVCGAPHHRACWQREGHCHFEADHGTPRQWKRVEPQSKETPVNRCPNCGADNPEHAEFCSRCGRSLNVREWTTPPGQQPPVYGQQPPQESYHEYAPFRAPFDPLGGVPRDEEFEGGVTAEELAVSVGSNATYYLPRFRRIKQGRTIQWNWAAFLITPYWLLYRKQYLAGTVVSLFSMAVNLLISFVFKSSGVISSSTTYEEAIELAYQAGNFPSLFLLSMALIVMYVMFGLFGNRLYMSTCLKKVKRARELDPEEFHPTLQRTGGISFLWGAVAYFAISFGTSIISALLL